MSDLNPIIAFYENKSEKGLPNLNDILNGSFEYLENSHNWCQRAFPNFEESRVVPNAPVLTDVVLEYLKKYQTENTMKLVFRYFIHYTDLQSESYAHNNRRVTRMIKYLKLLELEQPAEAVYIMFSSSYGLAVFDGGASSNGSHNTLKIWEEALKYNKGDTWIVAN